MSTTTKIIASQVLLDWLILLSTTQQEELHRASREFPITEKLPNNLESFQYSRVLLLFIEFLMIEGVLHN